MQYVLRAIEREVEEEAEMHRLFRVTAALVAMLLIISWLRFTPVAAQQDNGVTSDTTYESPSFGYQLEWEPGWEVQPEGTSSSENVDSLYLYNDEHRVGVTIGSGASHGRSADALLEIYRGFLEENYGVLTDAGFDSKDPDAPCFVVSYDLVSIAFDEYVQVTEYGDALIIVTMRTLFGFGLDLAGLVSSEIQLDGDDLLPSFGSAGELDETATTTPQAKAPDVPNGYESYALPTIGMTLAYNPEFWT